MRISDWSSDVCSSDLVARHAQKTDAEQSVKAMLLDRTATANAKPELEIFADDVKCAHGATVGELDKAALFYMASRGMEPGLARTLLLRSFRSEEHTSELQSIMHSSYPVLCMKTKQ